MVRVVVRVAPELADTVILTVWEPVPEVGERMIQEGLPLIDQLQVDAEAWI